jgi:4-methoxybenzoate monooxygenase (O-demethylating)
MTGSIVSNQEVPVLDVDPFSDEILANPYPFYKALHQAGPIAYIPIYDCYAVGRHAETQSAFSDWRRFSSLAGTGLGHSGRGSALRRSEAIVEVDPPEHTAMRKELGRILSPSVVRTWHLEFEAEAERLVAEQVAKGEFDAVTDLVEPFILKVLPDAMGIGYDGRKNLLPIGDLTGNALGPPNARFLEAQEKIEPLMPWFMSKFEREAMLPGGFGEKIWELGDTGAIDPAKVMPLIRTFIRGGTDTGISGISSLLWLMATNPDQWDAVRADPKLARGAFEEALRLETPAQMLFRTTQGEVDFAGFTLKDDVKVLCSLAAANRDPEKWPDADMFNVKRSTVGHLAFGTGIHNCIGRMIALIEAETILLALQRQVESIELAGPVRHRLNNTARRLESVPLRVIPRKG